MLKNFNTLDWFIRDSEFDGNQVAVSNNPGAGNFHCYSCVFKNSLYQDITLLNTGNFNIRDCFSIGSNMFFHALYYYTNAAQVRLDRNKVIIPETSAGLPWLTPPRSTGLPAQTVYMGQMGPLVMTDNVFVSPTGDARVSPKKTGPLPVVACDGIYPPNCLSVGNTFTVPDAIDVSGRARTPGNLVSIDDKIVDASTIDQTVPTINFAVSYSRRVFEIPALDNGTAIQAAVSRAGELNGQKPIIHIPFGDYHLTESVVIAANCDVQIVGDGARTCLYWNGGVGPMFLLEGPSRATFRDIQLNGSNKHLTVMAITGAEQAGGRVFMHQPELHMGQMANLFVDGLDNLNVELHDSNLTGTKTFPAATRVFLKVTGGPLAAAGKPAGGRVALFAGSHDNNYRTIGLANGAHVIIQDFWFKSSRPEVFGIVSDNCIFTLEGSRIAVPTETKNVLQFRFIYRSRDRFVRRFDVKYQGGRGQHGPSLDNGN